MPHLTTDNLVFYGTAAVLAMLFVYLWRRKELLSVFTGGRWWLTWMAIAILTLMDELTSIFYAPAEAFRFIGESAIIFIALTSILMRFLANRMTEIAQILEHHNIKGGGVYSFSYFVLGPTASFIAVASIFVTYVLTASISTVSAVQNGLSLFDVHPAVAMAVNFAIVWGVAGLNILGIRENARFTFGIFTVAATVLILLLVSGFLAIDGVQAARIGNAATGAFDRFLTLDLGQQTLNIGYLVIGTSSCILAYSGIESVIQTAGLVRSWHDIRKAYLFLAVTVGIFTPLISMLVLSSPLDPMHHETDLITQYAVMLRGTGFGLLVSAVASFTLIMAVNTAYVASSELLERVAEKYDFHWLSKVNHRHSLYRIHIISAILYSVIIVVTSGQQALLAEMYAIGLIASFAINMGSLLVYRYFKGTKEIGVYFTHRSMTLIVFIIVVASLGYLMVMRPYGTALWAITTGLFLFIGLGIARKRSPEIKELRQTDNPFELIAWLGAHEGDRIHLYFRRPKEEGGIEGMDSSRAYISFYSARQGIPSRAGENHFRFPFTLESVYSSICTIIDLIRYELPHMRLSVHLGWPMSSWMDRWAIGILVMNLMRLPKKYPGVTFRIEYDGREDVKG
ncbi:MAG: APC family permease [Ignavibacteriae bacterium]|nr:APC family permease [Ignavibacteriota bacterium]